MTKDRLTFWQSLGTEPLRSFAIVAVSIITAALVEVITGSLAVLIFTVGVGVIFALLALVYIFQDANRKIVETSTTLRNQLMHLGVTVMELEITVHRQLMAHAGSEDFSKALSHEELLKTAISVLQKAKKRALVIMQNPSTIMSWSNRITIQELEKGLIDTIRQLSEKNVEGNFTFLLCVSRKYFIDSLNIWKQKNLENVNRIASKMADFLEKDTSGFYVMSQHDLPPFLIISDEEFCLWVPDQRGGTSSSSDFIYVNYPARNMCDNLFKRYNSYYELSSEENKSIIGELRKFAQPRP